MGDAARSLLTTSAAAVAGFFGFYKGAQWMFGGGSVSNRKKRRAWEISSHIGEAISSPLPALPPPASSSKVSREEEVTKPDAYATPWNTVPLGVRQVGIYEPHTGELFRKLEFSTPTAGADETAEDAMSTGEGPRVEANRLEDTFGSHKRPREEEDELMRASTPKSTLEDERHGDVVDSNTLRRSELPARSAPKFVPHKTETAKKHEVSRKRIRIAEELQTVREPSIKPTLEAGIIVSENAPQCKKNFSDIVRESFVKDKRDRHVKKRRIPTARIFKARTTAQVPTARILEDSKMIVGNGATSSDDSNERPTIEHGVKRNIPPLFGPTTASAAGSNQLLALEA